jgi:circadian clock protein KaiB
MPTKKTKKTKKSANAFWVFHLYVAGQTPRSIAAFENLRKLCEEHLKGSYEIKLIDLAEKPQLASSEQIIALPTVIRKLPLPVRKAIGDLSNKEQVVVSLDLQGKV